MTDVEITENAADRTEVPGQTLKEGIIADSSSADKKDCIEGNTGVSSKNGTGGASPGKASEDANLAGPDTKVSGSKRKAYRTPQLLQKSRIQRLTKNTFVKFDEAGKVSQDAVSALTKSAEAFARVLCHVSSDLMRDNKRSKLREEDVYLALAECDFAYMVPTVKKCLEQEQNMKKQKKPSSKVSIKVLVDHNILQPGPEVLEILFKQQQVRAALTAEGKIHYDGREFSNPSGFSLYAMQKIDPDKKSANGWESVKYKGKALNQWKMEALSTLKINLESLKAKRAKRVKKAPESTSESEGEDDSEDESDDDSASDDEGQASSSEREEQDEEAQIMSVMDD